MRKHTLAWCAIAVALLSAPGCKKKSGPGGWLVGEEGLMANLHDDGSLGPGYDLGRNDDLYGIECRGLDDAFVVGSGGVFLRTFDKGATWETIDLGTDRTLRGVAAAILNDVVAVGDQAFFVSHDSGDSWTGVPVDTAGLESVAMPHDGSYALAVGDGAAWRWNGESLQQTAELPGVRAVALSHDGATAAAVGAGAWRSLDGGVHWTSIALPDGLDLHDVWAARDGTIVAVGAGGAMVTIGADDRVTVAHPGVGTLRTVHLTAGGHGMVAGDGGEVLMSHDGGASWARVSVGIDRTIYALDEIGVGHN